MLWAVINSFILGRVIEHKPFDPYPYILLNLVLSTVAGLQGGIILIASKRADQITSELAKHHYEQTIQLAEIIELNTQLTQTLHDHIISQAPTG